MVAVESEQELHRSELYINREIAALAFIRRVLEEAQSHRHPLLERVKFLSFVSVQMDEFLMVRMAGLHDQLLSQCSHARSRWPDSRGADSGAASAHPRDADRPAAYLF